MPITAENSRLGTDAYKFTYKTTPGLDAIRTAVDITNPMEVARAVVRDEYSLGSSRMLHYASKEYWLWQAEGPYRYEVIDSSEIRAKIWKFLDRNGTKPRKRNVDDVLDALQGQVTHSRISPPSWLNRMRESEPDVRGMISMENGILDTATRNLYPSTPDFFTLNALTYAYDPDAKAPAWLAFLESLWPDDPEAIEALQEWFGLLLTPETRYQKILMLVGPPRSGKGTILRVLRDLMGDENICAPTLAVLGSHFGISGLIGKLAAVITDARLSRSGDTAAVVETLLRISGEDGISADIKYAKRPWEGKLSTRIVILTNEIPTLADTSGALASRFVILQMRRSFLGNEDPCLSDKLLLEVPGILNWALCGLDRLRTRGRLIQPQSAADAVEQLDSLASPVKTFVRDQCIVESYAITPRREIFRQWMMWCSEQERQHPGTEDTFGRNLRAVIPTLSDSRPRYNGKPERCYIGIRLRRQSDDPPDPTDPTIYKENTPRKLEQAPPLGETLPSHSVGSAGSLPPIDFSEMP